MTSDLKKTWNDVASHWDDWGPPLRPSDEDLRITENLLARWHAGHPGGKTRVFLCGVTPEIVTMSWPFPIELFGMDQAESMVRIVWPGDVPGLRRAVVGNWLDAGLDDHSQDVVIGDGGFGFFSYPDGQRALLTEMSRLLKPTGIFLYRHYAQIERKELPGDVIRAAREGRVGNFHVFKWRLAMAIQPDGSAGVRQHDIWEAWNAAGIDTSRLPQPGWSESAVGTIDFYRNKEARLYFPTLDEFRALLMECFGAIEVRSPTYELGDRCPILAARPRA
jgi:SAM-dependent methyltransferase